MVNRFVLAASAARSNLGMNVDPRTQQWALGSKSLQDAVGTIFNDLIESEEMYDSFLEEAESWYNRIKNLTDLEIIKQYPELTKGI